MLPELEKQRTELENTEFIKMIRSANISPNDLSAFVEEYRARLTRNTKPEVGRSEILSGNAPQPPAPNNAAVSRREEAFHENE